MVSEPYAAVDVGTDAAAGDDGPDTHPLLPAASAARGDTRGAAKPAPRAAASTSAPKLPAQPDRPAPAVSSRPSIVGLAVLILGLAVCLLAIAAALMWAL
jgi:hypothetical protein